MARELRGCLGEAIEDRQAATISRSRLLAHCSLERDQHDLGYGPSTVSRYRREL
jgi:hypothetical protein